MVFTCMVHVVLGIHDIFTKLRHSQRYLTKDLGVDGLQKGREWILSPCGTSVHLISPIMACAIPACICTMAPTKNHQLSESLVVFSNSLVLLSPFTLYFRPVIDPVISTLPDIFSVPTDFQHITLPDFIAVLSRFLSEHGVCSVRMTRVHFLL